MVKPPCFDSNGMKKGAWSKEEDDKLRAYILRYGHWNWRLLPKYAGLARCGKSCRLRWVNYLKPCVKRGNFTKHEQNLVIQLHARLGNKWSAIAARLPGRTDNEVKNFWHTRVDKHRRKSSTPAVMTPNDDDDNNSVDIDIDDGVFSFKEAHEALMSETTSTTTTSKQHPVMMDNQQQSSSSSSAVYNLDHERAITQANETETWPAADIFLPDETLSYNVDHFPPLMDEVVGYNYDDIINGFNADFHCSEVSISSDSTYLTGVDHWSIGDLEDQHTISSDLWGAVDSNFSTNLSERAEGGFYDALLPDQYFNDHGFNY